MNPLGYTYLNQYYSLLLPKLDVDVYQDPKADAEKLIAYGASKRKIIPGTRKPADSPFEHMIAAIKYQGIRLHYFAAIFQKIDIDALTSFIAEKPNSKYNRVIWFLYEWLTGNQLTDIPNHTLDKIVSILINCGGKVSKAKQKFVSEHIKTDVLETVEETSSAPIQKMKDKLNVDVQQLMRKK